jgi:hypothetical protein
MLGPGVGEGMETVPVFIVEVGSAAGMDGVGTFAVIVAGGLLVGSTGTTAVMVPGVDIGVVVGVVVGAPGVSVSSWRQPARITNTLNNSNALRGGNKSLNKLVSGIMSPSFI